MIREYYTRLSIIWQLELSFYISPLAFNWSVDKIPTTAGNFHKNSHVNRLYSRRNKSGRGLRSVQTAFQCCMVSLRKLLLNNSSRNKYINAILKSEVNNIVRFGSDLLKKHSLPDELIYSPQTAGLSYMRELDGNHLA